MPRTVKNLSILTGIAVALLLICATPKVGWAQAGNPNLYGVTYFNLGGSFDGKDDVDPASTSFVDNGVHYINATDQTLCAEIYVFDSHEELQECCACPLTSNASLENLVARDLISDPAFPAGYGPTGGIYTGLITIAAAPLTQAAGVPKVKNGCPDAGGAPLGSTVALYTTAPTITEWIHHNGLTESPLTSATFAPESVSLESRVHGSPEVNFRYTFLNTTTQANLEDECSATEHSAKGGVCKCPSEPYSSGAVTSR